MAKLPPLREELALHEGPTADDGSPTWVLEDPARDRFFQLGRLQGEMLFRWGLGTPEKVAAAVNAETLLKTDAKAVEAFAKFLLRSSLTREAGASRRLEEESRRKPAETAWKFLLHHYLFFRIPLAAPDRFLRRTLLFVERTFLTKTFVLLTLAAAFIALYLTSRQWDAFTHTFQHFFTWEGAAAAAVTLAVTKVIHELGHAYTAEHFGCRIPHMGIAFMVMMPLLYTDTSSAWRLSRKSERMAVCAGGVAAELSLGAWAALLWSFLPEGLLKSAAFMLATTTWIMTLGINLSPFMRFDGYYLFSDWVGVANLHQRSFALAKWRMREFLFGFGDPKPEAFEPWKERVLVIYAWATWLYRFFLFCGIALLVYHAFFKLLGILLFCVEVSVFVMLPILKELKVWIVEVFKGRSKPKGLLLLIPIAILIGVFFTPWSARISAPAVMKPAHAAALYAPVGARVEKVLVKPGDRVMAGDLLIELSSPALENELKNLAAQRESLRWRSEYLRLDRTGAAEAPAAERELLAVERRIAVAEEAVKALKVTSPFSGKIVQMAEPLDAGEWVAEGELLAAAAAESTEASGVMMEAVGFVNESDLHRFVDGASAAFFPEDAFRAPLGARVASASPTAAKHLAEAPELSSAYGGALAAAPVPPASAQAQGIRAAGLAPETLYAPREAVYQVRAKCAAPSVDGQVLRGTLVIEGERESLAGRFARYAFAVLLRESSF